MNYQVILPLQAARGASSELPHTPAAPYLR
jgi:hypothetical protein